MEQIQEIIRQKTEELEEIISKYLPAEVCRYQQAVVEAMNYSMLAGGKRLRPMLMWETYRMFGGSGREIEPLMAAIEMIHTYSLVHDDLPAMDNDEYRRGRRTTHAVYGEAMGILAGDGLLNLAWETAMRAFQMGSMSVGESGGSSSSEELVRMRRIADAIAVLAGKAGIYGMIGGQTADIEAEESQRVSMEQLLFIHERKTAALIQAAMMVGAILAGADEEQVRQMERCARDIGVAFQIQDDILDVTGTMEELGKPVGSDEKNHKQTYVTLMGIEASAMEVERLSREALKLLADCGGDSSFLQALTKSLIHRTK
ncbi:MAG: polyprenyl synthetase family protein [bacterium]|nr:polyprenyl synthetase family protein [bacterium]MCM1376006.1 polyprenyl synthetase family protein [Muribaculum sp.]